METYEVVLFAAVITFTLTAAVIDYRTRRIPNWLTVESLVLAILFHTVTAGFAGLGFALAGFAAGFGILFVLWLIGGGGGGDVKLMAALGAWLGAKSIVIVFLLSAACAVVATLLLALVQLTLLAFARGKSAAKKSNPAAPTAQRPLAKLTGWALPYALPVAVGTWALLAWQLVLQR